jgi:uncharacterized membrane protein YoaK (UPF0700 family)
MQPDYNKSQAYVLLFVQLIFIVILFCMLAYWHYSHPNSLDVTAELEKELLENSAVSSENH